MQAMKAAEDQKFLFTEAMLRDQMISEKFNQHEETIDKIIQQHETEESKNKGEPEIPVMKVKEIWYLISLTIRAVMIKAGTSIVPGDNNVKNDLDCVEELYKHMYLFVSN